MGYDTVRYVLVEVVLCEMKVVELGVKSRGSEAGATRCGGAVMRHNVANIWCDLKCGVVRVHGMWRHVVRQYCEMARVQQ